MQPGGAPQPVPSLSSPPVSSSCSPLADSAGSGQWSARLHTTYPTPQHAYGQAVASQAMCGGFR